MHNQEENGVAVITVASNKISKERGKTLENRKTSLNIRKLKKQVKGITLLALVVTIIVLLILAGVSIATLTGDNGILTRAQDAKDKTEQAKDIEKISLAVSEAQIGENGYQKLDQNNLQEAIDNQFEGRDVVVSDNGDGTFTISCLDTLKDYIISDNSIEEGIDWNEAMTNAIAPASQDEARNDGVIAIGTDGKPVNMDLWEYTLINNGTEFILNDSESATDKGYKGSYTENGEISENQIDVITIPQYISLDNGESFKPVTSLSCLFRECTDLRIAPAIPATVKNIKNMFHTCSNLENAINIPSNVTNIQGIFYNCTSLAQAPVIANSVENMQGAFQGCINLIYVPNLPISATNLQAAFRECERLTEIPELPPNIQNMFMTFYNCKNLKSVSKIPKSVTNMCWAFQNCYNLSGTMEIVLDEVSGVDSYKGAFLEACLNGTLTLKCSEDVYNLFFNNTDIIGSSTGIVNIKVEKI